MGTGTAAIASSQRHTVRASRRRTAAGSAASADPVRLPAGGGKVEVRVGRAPERERHRRTRSSSSPKTQRFPCSRQAAADGPVRMRPARCRATPEDRARHSAMPRRTNPTVWPTGTSRSGCQRRNELDGAVNAVATAGSSRARAVTTARSLLGRLAPKATRSETPAGGSTTARAAARPGDRHGGRDDRQSEDHREPQSGLGCAWIGRGPGHRPQVRPPGRHTATRRPGPASAGVREAPARTARAPQVTRSGVRLRPRVDGLGRRWPRWRGP